MPQEVGKKYKELLRQYIDRQNEKDLYFGQQFIRKFIEKNIPPEDVISIHKTALMESVPDMPDSLNHSFDFLIEMMIHYGLALREHQSLIRKQEELQMEMNVALKVQDTLLKTEVPSVEGLDIGLVTESAKQMSGDYVYFLCDGNDKIGVAVADVMGKGIPAALCMTMVKFGLDSLQNDNTSPQNALAAVNRIVEKSVDDSMFISMFYGKYNMQDFSFSYSSAGHEPALLYKSSENIFKELGAKGLLLGVLPDFKYEERTVQLEKGDFLVIMTDGVTEARTETDFIDEAYIQDLLEKAKGECAQTIAEKIYEELASIQNYRLHDDFTIVVLKRD
ncbi:PP2C family protein-serine/threonine phosphatase [Sporosarcina sp. HYO08]|uniref:PP2C family protein-serine/threonine phosphatase n=1 Tax=Sporosarcina sp. HYO08 TaxID=1759557 RepID=UPI0009E96B81|nr:PP2C family protein-serine/threonine phosphatase [Sporosarcina sp. HYO08]